jgi:DNA-binding NtrC family response regulator
VKDQLEALITRMIEHGIQYSEAVAEFEKRFIQQMLEKTNGNHSKAAKALGIHRNTLSRKVGDFDLERRPRRRRRSAR